MIHLPSLYRRISDPWAFVAFPEKGGGSLVPRPSPRAFSRGGAAFRFLLFARGGGSGYETRWGEGLGMKHVLSREG